MAKFFKEIRAYPGRWVGVNVQYNSEFIEWLKDTIPLKAWDKANSTWWFPESFEPIVTAELVRRNILTPALARAFSAEFYAHQKLGTKEEPYKILGLQMGAPRPMIDFAYQFWKRHYASASGTGMQTQEVEHAYQQIIAETVMPVSP